MDVNFEDLSDAVFARYPDVDGFSYEEGKFVVPFPEVQIEVHLERMPPQGGGEAWWAAASIKGEPRGSYTSLDPCEAFVRVLEMARGGEPGMDWQQRA